MRTVIIGCGTIGLAFGAALAARGSTVVLQDRNERHLALIETGGVAGDEPDQRAALAAGLASGRITTSPVLTGGEQPSNFIICVPTSDASLTDLRAVVLAIAAVARPDDAVFIRSTVPPGTTRRLSKLVAEQLGRPLVFAAMPDRSVEGRSFADQFAVPHLLGAVDSVAEARGRALLGVLGEVVALPSPEAAEAAKMFSNVWRAATFATVNAFALVADDHGLDLHQILDAASAGYPRFHPPRPGLVGGPCLPKDLRMLAESERPESVALFSGIRTSEQELARRVRDRAIAHLSQWRQAPARVAFLGLAFKGRPAVADMRGSPALALSADIAAACPEVEQVGWDPSGGDLRHAGTTGIALCGSPREAVAGAALTVLGHDHPDILSLDLTEISAHMAKGGLVMDLTGLAGNAPGITSLHYWGLGRSTGRRDAGH